mmetsp:Transcript_60335/g.73924  ORF Transcript_60335/g.73924 Transcript_60335/m.73924 type:complete len:479 (+) Transcript_60335:637-2073(+)
MTESVSYSHSNSHSHSESKRPSLPDIDDETAFIESLANDIHYDIINNEYPTKIIINKIFNKKRYNKSIWKQESELNVAHSVVCHEPGNESLFGATHPCGALFEQPLSIDKAKKEFKIFKNKLKKNNVNPLTVREILVSKNSNRNDLINFAMNCLHYKLINQNKNIKSMNNYTRYISDKYKLSVLKKFTKNELIDIILAQPTIELEKCHQNTGYITKSINLNPLMNLIFCRDQQFTTNNGIVMGSMNSYQRKNETVLMKYVWNTLNAPIIYEINNSNNDKFIEGGDFIPINNDYCLIGCGLRTNLNAIKDCLANDVFGTKYVCIVLDKYDQNQDRMHLDCVFNVVSSKYCVLLDTIINHKTNPNKIRHIIKYERTKVDNKHYYVKCNDDDDLIEFTHFIKSELKMNIIPVTNEQQLKYMINFINLGNGRIFCVNKHLNNVLKKHMKTNDYNNIKCQYFDFTNITSMYGAAHCCSQVFRQ